MEIHPQYNPPTYIRDVVDAGVGHDVNDYSVEYKNSELYKSNRERNAATDSTSAMPFL
ncbi:hypothetical protein PI125_g1918 [Phytophthora idaei]|nr:hypothetical protein PI125_g1918 [Phytophthora idaei]KAG3171756.1 hypothetical protein PI126_g1727 [Phytophthora idaei]